MVTSFRDEQVGLPTGSGWLCCQSVAQAVAGTGLPAPDAGYLAGRFSAAQWEFAERAVLALREHFAGARFAGEVVFGLLLIPDPARLDTRRPVSPQVRADQLGQAAPDVFDERLRAGVMGVPPGRDWTAVVTVTGAYGLSLGSYEEITTGPAGSYTVCGQDTRTLMIRQLWGARVLQLGSAPPDSEANDHWTFTLFPGEPLTGDAAESGTVLKGRVRFRLGKASRGIGPARVAPAIAIPEI